MEYIVNAQMKQFNLLMSQTEEAYHEAAVKLGLSDSVMLILYTLCCFDGECLLNDITAGASKQTINSALRKLEADDIVYLKAFEGRKKKVYLMDKGRRLVKDTVLRVIEIENEIFDGWSEEEKSTYVELTQRYQVEFRKKVKEL